MELNDVFIGRQPILDRQQAISGYELLFRNGQTASADVVDDVQATASVMVNALSNMGVKRLIGEKKGFINVDAGILKSGIIELLPKENSVLEILETVELTGEVVNQCRKLKREGYHFALDDFVYHESATPMFEIVDYVKVDVMLNSRNDIGAVVHALKRYPLTLLAEKVETREDFDFLRDLGFTLFQGYFFARPSVITAKSVSPVLGVLIQLLRLLSQGADLYMIEELFRKNPELNIKLLKFMNSASFYTTQKITSIRQSITLLGYRTLQKWVTLLLFAGPGGDTETNPLLERAAIRGRAAELLARRLDADSASSDSAFITGALSLADVLFQMPMDQTCKELNLSGDIEDALVQRKGFLGALLSMVESLDIESTAGVLDLLERFGLTLEDLFSIEKTAIMEYENYKDEHL
jgi:c-di-GMP-related signal transduction protein